MQIMRIKVSDFSREARAYCKQHRVYFYPNDAGCEQCERDREYEKDGRLENCTCSNTPEEIKGGINPICKIYVQYHDYFERCGRCGHLEGCHE